MSTHVSPHTVQRIEAAARKARKRLVRHMTTSGHWEGTLSSSALATAVAVFALAQLGSGPHRDLLFKGLTWLARNANADGGWGDTPVSKSNVSTTLLCWSAFTCAPLTGVSFGSTIDAAEKWLRATIGGLDPAMVARRVTHHYGFDRTFAAPILAMCALAGRLGDMRHAWRYVPQLPFEMAALPHRVHKALRLHVVSYALPALIAIGVLRHRSSHGTPSIRSLIRSATADRALALLEQIQPPSGGYLQAIPLTGFVVMSLVRTGKRFTPVVERGVRFLRSSMRPDGSWPIDTNVATWVTTLSLNALHVDPHQAREMSSDDSVAVRGWLLGQQYLHEHPYTHAAPGGWAWTDLPGGVPDADDTAGAALALTHLGSSGDDARTAALAGIEWLLDMQNGNGGIPTFCRGWGKLPFDRSTPDVTAHALRAFIAWRGDVDGLMRVRIDAAIRRALRYLATTQRSNGTWIPLWFGSEFDPHSENPLYGTARVIQALAEVATLMPESNAAALMHKGVEWIAKHQRPDGTWGGTRGAPGTIEETSLAVTALSMASDHYRHAVATGATWIADELDAHSPLPASPIGLYFSTLWYHERLYPYIFATEALTCASRRLITGVPQP